MNGQRNKQSLFYVGVLAFSIILANACHKSPTQNTSAAKAQTATPERPSDFLPEVKQALASRGCPEWLAEVAGMKSNDSVMDCASLHTDAQAWALWYWQDVSTEESRQLGDEEFALTRTIVDANTREIQFQGDSDKFSQHHAYGKGPNRIDILDLDGDGRDEVLETVGGGQQGVYWTEYLIVQMGMQSAMSFVELPVGGYAVIDFSANDKGEMVCTGELKVAPNKKGSQLVFTGSLFFPDNPNAQECPQPQHVRLQLEGSSITTQNMMATAPKTQTLTSEAQCNYDSDCNQGYRCQIVPDCDTCDGGGTYCVLSR